MDEKANSTNMHQGATPEIFRNAESLRSQMTGAERVLWEVLRKKRLDGFKFRRQHPIGKYALDFYCHQAKLAIEQDGQYHEDQAQRFYDADRTNNLEELGIMVIRFQNKEVLEGLHEVLEEIREEVMKRIG